MNNNQNNSSNDSQNNSGSWMNDPRLNGMDKSKLEILQQLADQGSQKSQNDLMPFLMAAASSGKSQGVQFSPDEIRMIIEVIKMGKSPKEQARLDKIVSIMSMMHR